ncbi:SsrA-binding protein, partial [Candidatus Saccharibacteria bacterium]|nr:SsrA-binding protein [Candidatus Saccharibacteria bacterium]
ESYIRPKKGELLLVGAHITQYSHDNSLNYEPIRNRKLLMHKREIIRLQAKVEQKGNTLVPLRIYLKHGMAKLELALAKGKSAPDKRRSIQEREQGVEIQRALKHAKR